MKYIKLEDGISIEENLAEVPEEGFFPRGISYVLQTEADTLGKEYDPMEDIFKTIEEDLKEVMDVLSQKELIAIDAILEINPIRHKLMMNLVTGAALTDEEMQLSYNHMVNMNIMAPERLQELIAQTGLSDYIVE